MPHSRRLDDEEDFRSEFIRACDTTKPTIHKDVLNKAIETLETNARNVVETDKKVDKAIRNRLYERPIPLGTTWQEDADGVANMIEAGYRVTRKRIEGDAPGEGGAPEGQRSDVDVAKHLTLDDGNDVMGKRGMESVYADLIKGVRRITRRLPETEPQTGSLEGFPVRVGIP